MEKVLETGIYCKKCECLIKDKDIADMECAYSCGTEPWENIEIVMRSRKNERVMNALKNVNRAAEKISAVESEIDEY